MALYLIALAGYVDALGFLQLGGLFASFMSGNSTQLGVDLSASLRQALLPLGLIGLFVTGVVAGSLVRQATQGRPPVVVLVCVTVLLAAAALLADFGVPAVAMAMVTIAMGAVNTAFEGDGGVSPGATYITGTLVKLGRSIAAALLGGERMAWVWHLLLWLSLVAGAVAGALAYTLIGLDGLWIAAAVAAIPAAVGLFMPEPA